MSETLDTWCDDCNQDFAEDEVTGLLINQVPRYLCKDCLGNYHIHDDHVTAHPTEAVPEAESQPDD